MTGSACFTIFAPITGSVMDISPGGTDQGAGILGMEYNRVGNRVLLEAVAYVSATGSNPNGVARVDIQVQQGPVQPANFSTVFLGNATKLAVSGSSGLSPIKASGASFVSGTNTIWPAGTLLLAKVDLASGIQAGLGAMRGLVVQLFWKPTGSYGTSVGAGG
jgi:hypothetical protein